MITGLNFADLDDAQWNPKSEATPPGLLRAALESSASPDSWWNQALQRRIQRTGAELVHAIAAISDIGRLEIGFDDEDIYVRGDTDNVDDSSITRQARFHMSQEMVRSLGGLTAFRGLPPLLDAYLVFHATGTVTETLVFSVPYGDDMDLDGQSALVCNAVDELFPFVQATLSLLRTTLSRTLQPASPGEPPQHELDFGARLDFGVPSCLFGDPRWAAPRQYYYGDVYILSEGERATSLEPPPWLPQRQEMPVISHAGQDFHAWSGQSIQVLESRSGEVRMSTGLALRLSRPMSLVLGMFVVLRTGASARRAMARGLLRGALQGAAAIVRASSAYDQMRDRVDESRTRLGNVDMTWLELDWQTWNGATFEASMTDASASLVALLSHRELGREHDVFLSYARVNSDLMGFTKDALTSSGLSVFVDVEMRPGLPWRKETIAAIHRSACMVLIATKDSIDSREVLMECAGAQVLGRDVYVFRKGVTSEEMPSFLSAIHSVEWSVEELKKFAVAYSKGRS
ncbi:MAG: toll/interleukin-1 receptor domain-containing protein [Planctomycetota bacterium]